MATRLDELRAREARKNAPDLRLKNGFIGLQNDRTFSPASWGDGAPPQREFLVDGCFPKGSVVLLSGDGGLGKSLLMQQLCTAISLGRAWLGMPGRQVKAYGLFCEDDRDELWRRQQDINRHYECGMGDLEDVLYRSRPGRDNILCRFGKWDAVPQPTPLFHAMISTVKQFGAQLVVIDTASDVFGGNEIAKDQVRAFITLLRGWAIDIDGCIVLTAHVSNEGLSSGSGLSGSRAWSNSVRARLWLTGKSKDGGDERYLRTMKANYGRAGGKIPLKWANGVFVVSEPPAPKNYAEPSFPADWT